MNADFSRSLSVLRAEKGISQRSAASDLGISQALLSHYENGIREPGLAFVGKACDYYGVSADYLLGRTLSRDGTTIVGAEELYDLSTARNSVLQGSVMATLTKKLLINSMGLLFDLLGKLGSKAVIKAAADYLGTAIYWLYRTLYCSDPSNNGEFFAVPPRHFDAALPLADMINAQVDYMEGLDTYNKDKGEYPPMNHNALTQEYPGLYQSLLQIIHTTSDRINKKTAFRKEIGSR